MVVGAVRQVLPVVRQHAEDSATLRRLRSVLVAAPNVKLHHLARLDDRIAANLDGLAVAGEAGEAICTAALETPGTGEVFAKAVRAIEGRNTQQLNMLIALVRAMPDAESGLISALGWVSAQFLREPVKAFLAADDPLRRRLGIAACVMHRLDPGVALDTALVDDDSKLRARALRAAAECGRQDLLPLCLNALVDEVSDCRTWGARAAVLLGDRAEALNQLVEHRRQPGQCEAATLLALMAAQIHVGHALVQELARNPTTNMRRLLRSAGVVGDPHFVPWLIKHMSDSKLARLAGESFSMVTGLDLAYLDLDRKPPENVEAGPSDNPADPNVAMDPDEGLPWPDPERVQRWWSANQARFVDGTRYFMGEPPSRELCVRVLKEGFQRQRIAAAEYLCVLQPGTPLFNTAAPAWRQQRLLSKLT